MELDAKKEKKPGSPLVGQMIPGSVRRALSLPLSKNNVMQSLGLLILVAS